jgi:hypothetical protein
MQFYLYYPFIYVGRNSVVYTYSGWLRFGREIESSGAHSASYTIGTGSFPGVKRTGRDVNHPPPSSDDVKEKVELYIYPLLGVRGLLYGKLYIYFFL